MKKIFYIKSIIIIKFTIEFSKMDQSKHNWTSPVYEIIEGSKKFCSCGCKYYVEVNGELSEEYIPETPPSTPQYSQILADPEDITIACIECWSLVTNLSIYDLLQVVA